MSYVGFVINYITDSWSAMWPVDRERYKHDAPLAPGYSMLLALAGRDVKPMSKPSDAWLLYRYSKLCGMLKYHVVAYFDPLAESVCSAFLNEGGFPVYDAYADVMLKSKGNTIDIFIRRGLDNFLEQSTTLRFPSITSLNVGLIGSLLRGDDFLNADVRDGDTYYELANFIHENRGSFTSFECLCAFVGVVFAKHWMHKANEGLMDHYTFARPCLTYVKTVLEFYLEKPRCLEGASLVLETSTEGYIHLRAYLPYLGDEYEPDYEMRAVWFEEFIDRKKRHLRSLL